MVKAFLYRFTQLTWGIIQTFLGFLLFLLNIKNKHQSYNGAIITYWPKKVGISLGMFIFSYQDKDMIRHEYGHTIQSLFLGPLYLIIVGIPSFIWANLPYFINKRKNEHITYDSFIIEKNANILGDLL